MNQHRLVTLVTVLLVAFAAPAFAAAPLTIERYRQNVERVAPIFPTIPEEPCASARP